MKPKRYPYVKPKWDKEATVVYAAGNPCVTLVTYINRLNGKTKQ